ncbi:MAG: redoxin domain-containing protein [Pirellulales bacterium]
MMILNNTPVWLVAVQMLVLTVNQLASAFAQEQGKLETRPDRQRQVEMIDGQAIDLRSTKFKGTIVVFISTDCPIANSYQPLLEQFRGEWSQRELQMVMIHGNPEVNIDHAKQHAKEYGIHWSVAIDPQQRIAKSLQAKNIPEAFVLDASGSVVYRGRIDDQYSALGKKRPEPTSRDLKDAVENLLAGKPVAFRETKAVGCVIRYANR